MTRMHGCGWLRIGVFAAILFTSVASAQAIFSPSPIPLFVTASMSIHIQNMDATTTTAPAINAKNNPNMPNIPNISYVIPLLNVPKPLPGIPMPRQPLTPD